MDTALVTKNEDNNLFNVAILRENEETGKLNLVYSERNSTESRVIDVLSEFGLEDTINWNNIQFAE